MFFFKVKEDVSFNITLQDEGEHGSDNIVSQSITFIVADVNDNAPKFIGVRYMKFLIR